MTDEQLIADLDDAAKWLATSRLTGHEVKAIEVCSVVCVAKERIQALSPSRLSANDEGVADAQMARASDWFDANYSDDMPEDMIIYGILEAALSTKPEAGEDERCLTPAEQAVVGKSLRTSVNIVHKAGPTPTSGEQMEVVGYKQGYMLSTPTELIKEYKDNPKVYGFEPLVTLDAAQKALTASNERAERAEEAEDEAKDCFWAIYPDWCEMRGHGISTEAARTALVTRAETAEALNTTLSEALEPFARRAPVQGFSAGIPWDMHLRAYDAYCAKYRPQKALIEGGCRGGFSTDELDMFIPGWREEVAEDFRRVRTALAGLPAKQGGQS